MFKGYPKQRSRKRLETSAASAYSDLLSLRSTAATPAAEMFDHNAAGIAKSASGAPNVFYSSAGYYAHNPQLDQHVLKVEDSHIFAAAFTAKTTARGGYYLKQHLHSELKAQILNHKGDVSLAIAAAITVLNTAFRKLHPFNPEVLEGVHLALAYIDRDALKIYLASTGHCRCVAGGRGADSKIRVVAEVGREVARPDAIQAVADSVVCIPWREDVASLALGSDGIWEELSAEKALLRLEHHWAAAPEGSAAAHLTNFALHSVTRRMRASRDLRMSSLCSVGSLHSLQAGNRSQYKFASRQPVRRRRGDVHSDFTAVVLRFDWPGRSCSQNSASPGNAQSSTRSKPLARWDLVRLHFVDFAKESRAATEEKWIKLIQDVILNKALVHSAAMESKANGSAGKYVEVTADGSSKLFA